MINVGAVCVCDADVVVCVGGRTNCTFIDLRLLGTQMQGRYIRKLNVAEAISWSELDCSAEALELGMFFSGCSGEGEGRGGGYRF